MYNCEPLAMYHPNQWRQVQNQSTQPETSVANNNPQNNEANSSPVTSTVNANAVIPSRGRILTISGGNSMEHDNNNQKRNYFRRVNSISMEGPFKKTR